MKTFTIDEITQRLAGIVDGATIAKCLDAPTTEVNGITYRYNADRNRFEFLSNGHWEESGDFPVSDVLIAVRMLHVTGPAQLRELEGLISR